MWTWGCWGANGGSTTYAVEGSGGNPSDTASRGLSGLPASGRHLRRVCESPSGSPLHPWTGWTVSVVAMTSASISSVSTSDSSTLRVVVLGWALTAPGGVYCAVLALALAGVVAPAPFVLGGLLSQPCAPEATVTRAVGAVLHAAKSLSADAESVLCSGRKPRIFHE